MPGWLDTQRTLEAGLPPAAPHGRDGASRPSVAPSACKDTHRLLFVSNYISYIISSVPILGLQNNTCEAARVQYLIDVHIAFFWSTNFDLTFPKKLCM